MKIPWRPLLFGGITALAALATHRGYSAFHDGVRPFVRDVAEGRQERPEAARTTWDMSAGFVYHYAIPTSLATGVMGKHLLGLPADWIGIRLRKAPLVVGAGLLWGAAASCAVSGAHWIFGNLPRPIDSELIEIGRPLLAMMPLIPVVAAASQFGVRRGGLVVGAVTTAAYVAAAVTDLEAAPAVAFGIGAVVHIILATRQRVDEPPPLPEPLAAGRQEVRRGTLPLMVIGALLAVGTSLFWLAGEPASVMLVGLGHPLEAALIGLYSWIGFVPLVTYTALASRAYTSAGMPDGVLALGLLIPFAPAAAVAGAAGMWAELWGVGRFERLMSRYPGLHGAGAAIRDGLLLVSEIALLVGGFITANAMWPGVGLFVVGGFWLLNEVSGTRVMRVAIGPLAAILVGLAANVRVWIS
ncbi:YhfT family protein [Georgenia sp. AZ-5]|uniref:YhfT family protein n=1 Tax=Georgenia sp. AZ-5 TaxID=3367526 RepID=UPI003753F064